MQFHRLVAAARWRRIAKWAVGAILVLIAVAVLLIQTDPVQQFLLRRAEEFARGAGIPFTAKHVRLKIFDLELSVSGFVYDNKGVRVEADNLTVDFPSSIYRSEGLVMNSLEADGLRITISSTDSSTEPALPEPSGKTTSLPRVVAERLNIRNASFSYANQSTRVEIPSFTIEALSGKGELKLNSPITITPDTSIEIPEVPLQLSPDGLRFGPTQWAVEYGSRKGSGLADGTFRWSPAIGAILNFSTNELAIENWNGLIARGKAIYEDGVLNLEDFRVTRGNGELTGSARISDETKSARMMWDNIRLDPSGVRGETDGQLDLHWRASDFTDITGAGRIAVSTRDYGKAESNVQIMNGRAQLNLRAASMGADIRAAIETGLDRRLSGSFRLTHRQYGLITADGRLSGTLISPQANARIAATGVMYNGVGPLDGSAQASYRNDILDVSALMAQLKGSMIPDGSLRVNVKTRRLEGSIPAINVELGDFLQDGVGQIQSSAQLSGVIDHPAATLVASSQGLDIGGTHIDNVEANAALDGNIVQLTKLVARQKDGMFEASGTVDLETEQTQAVAHVTNLQITQVRNFSATVNLDADVSGSYRAPSANLNGEVADIAYNGEDHGSVKITGTAGIETLDLHLQSVKYNADVDGTLSTKPPYNFTAAVRADQSPIQYEQYDFVANGRAQASGSLQPTAVGMLQLENFAVTGEGIDLKANGSLDAGVKVDLVADLASVPVQDVKLDGQAKIDAVVRGPLDDPRVEGEVQTTNATVQTMQMPEAASVAALINFTRDRFEIRDMRADYADARVVVEGSGTLKGTGEFTFVAENIRPENLLADRPVTGLLGVEGRVKVNAPRVDSIEGEATITQFELNARGVEIRQIQKGEIIVANHVASLRNFILEGPETKASAGGTVDLSAGDLNFDIDADTDLRIVEGLIPKSTAFGRIESQVALRGSTAKPDMKGFINLTDAQLTMAEPPLLLSGINARVQLSENRAQIEQATGELNGGKLNITGETGVSSGGLDNAAIEVMLMGTQLEYPKGLQSEIAADLTLSGSSPALMLTGNVNVVDASYRENVNLREQVFQRLTPPGMELEAAQAPGFTEQINLDVTVDTTGPVSVANNLAKLDLTGTFRIRGTANDPVVLGRAATLEGGEVYFGPGEGESAALGERRDRYIIERGTIDFVNPLRTEPTIDIEATHDLQVKDETYAIRLRAMGTPKDLRTELTSDPYLSEPDIIAMLLTGRTMTELQGAHVAVAREQLLDYVSGQLTSRFFQGAGTALGLDTVTIEPATIAAEEDISARLTVGKDISRYLGLVYSQNLSGPRNQTWILNYTTLRNFVLRGINRPDQDEVRVELRHGVEFGGGPPLPRRVAPRNEVMLNSVNFDGSNFPTKDLTKYVQKPGKPYSISRMNDDIHSLQQFFASKGYADARIQAKREVSKGVVDAKFTIQQGPKISFAYRGFEIPEDVQKQVVQIWVDGRAEAPSLQESIKFVLRYLRDEGYLKAMVSSANEAQNPDERLYVFQIDPGMKFDHPKFVFQGTEPLAITDKAGEVLEDPEAIRDQIQNKLRGEGFLDAKSTVPELVIENGQPPSFAVSVDKGRQYMVNAVTHDGNMFFTDQHLTTTVIHGPTPVVPPGDAGAARPPETEEELKPFPYTSEWVSIARRRIMTEYWQQGFNSVQINASTNYVPDSGSISVAFDIREGERQQVAGHPIMGDEKTLRSHILHYFKFSSGDPVDYTRINLTRKQLYDTGLFKRVDVEVVNEPQGYVAQFNLNERAPWSIKYGFTVTDHKEQIQHDRDLGASLEITYRNLLGTGITTGVSGKLDASLKEARLFGSFPIFLGRDVSSTISLFRTRETFPGFIDDSTGVTLQQQWRLHDFYMLTYDYSYRRVRTIDRDLTNDDPDIVEGVVPIARFNVTLSRDTRDDILNATRGTFFSNSFDLAPPGIGSSVQYFKNYTQYLRFRQVWRPNLIYASAYKVGLARAFGGTHLLPADQFRAGGSTSLRAIADDNESLQSGNALFVTNQEMRFPLFWRFGGVGFFDIGNVYQRIGTTHILKQRYSPGVGLRINTPFILLRADFGLNLWPRTGEDSRRISFGIGQAF